MDSTFRNLNSCTSFSEDINVKQYFAIIQSRGDHYNYSNEQSYIQLTIYSKIVMDELGPSLRQFDVISKLGEGSFSCVYKVQRIDDKKFYAMKKVKIGQMREKQKENALNQVRILASITHPNIVNYRQAFFDDKTQTLCIVMQLADAGDIQKKINEHLQKKTFFNEVQIWQALIQMTKGLKSLHDINILHRDLKCANVFCTSDGKYKLGDLNVSKVAKRGMARTQTGTPYYTSPEVWDDKAYDSKCDIWSLGCVIYEMAALRPPFRASNLKELYAKIHRGLYQNIPQFYSDDLKNIIAQCLKVNPTQRLSASQILQNQVVIKKTPSSQVYSISNNQTSKCNLLKTILVPKNLKSLKEALPASKYDQPKEVSLQKKYKRANSANNLRKVEEIPRVLVSPKADEEKRQQLKYAFMRRPSSSNSRNEPQSERLEQHSKQGIRRENSGRLVRNNSMDMVRKRIQSNNSIDSKRDRSRDGSRDGSKNGEKFNMDDISNRCKAIEDKVKDLIERKRDLKEQRSPNLPIIKNSLQEKVQRIQRKYINYKIPLSREKDEASINKISGRNRSIELQKNDSNLSNRSNRGANDRSMEREKIFGKEGERNRIPSVEQKRSLERNNSRDLREYDRKRYIYAMPPKIVKY